ncbi:hypothetical protein [Janthinobacterium lividum]|uniref:Uncharacterized protein n=1 Tax=Janthinobacterium lividum TaxID=29581 RepID=A0ABU0XM25_9BURK|nr:hypothetical protein [Janthinobacterium lividum]MDQ4624572.1 hypothetical protein [Janthinobacterium lividum]MDQ4673824.1 hypothetical protein [Janthinobacterium lividum]MDQ4684554.1 hypothetical protein [Janthinobacterium lividum]
MTVMAIKWKNQEVRSYNGLVCCNGDIYEVHETSMARVREKPEIGAWLNVAILAQEELHGGQYIVKCGEAMEHGAIGVVVLESLQNHEPVWTFVSDQSNPFDQIIIKAGWIVVLSTSGAVFRFAAPMREARLLLPGTSIHGSNP